MSSLARRMFDLVEPIGLLPYSAEEANEAMFALGFTNYWDTYFAGRAAPLGAGVPAGVVHALFYNFGPGEVARHIPKVWSTTSPQAAIAARQQGCATALRRDRRRPRRHARVHPSRRPAHHGGDQRCSGRPSSVRRAAGAPAAAGPGGAAVPRRLAAA
jgi:hypothetical protein